MTRKPKPDVFFWEFAQRYVLEVSELHKPATLAHHKSVLQPLVECFGGQRMSEITRQDIQVYITSLIREGYAPATVRDHWNVLSGVLKYAETERLVDDVRWFQPKLPRNPRKPQPWWTVEQMRSLIEHSYGPMKTLIMLLAETGCRVGEALALQPEYIDFKNRRLHIHQNFSAGVLGTPKTQSSYRTLALSEELCYALSCLKSRPFVFALGSAPKIRYHLDKLCDRLRLPRCGFHAFRRGNITLCIRELRIPLEIVAGRVGHEAGDLTLDVYVQKMDDYDLQDVKRIAEVLYGSFGRQMRTMQQSHPPEQTEGGPGVEENAAGQNPQTRSALAA